MQEQMEKQVTLASDTISNARYTGTIGVVVPQKGYGFIVRDDDEKPFFFMKRDMPPKFKQSVEYWARSGWRVRFSVLPVAGLDFHGQKKRDQAIDLEVICDRVSR